MSGSWSHLKTGPLLDQAMVAQPWEIHRVAICNTGAVAFDNSRNPQRPNEQSNTFPQTIQLNIKISLETD